MATSLVQRMRKLLVRTLPKTTGPDQKVVGTVMQGFRMTVEDSNFEVLVPRLNTVDAAWRGFAYEGAGVGLTVFDYFTPWYKRVQAFVQGPGNGYIIPVYIGVGLALGRLKSQHPERFMMRLDHPAFRWMVIDGYGFYKGFFEQERYLTKQEVPAHLSTYARHVFDQGLGRGIWFAMNEDTERVVTAIATFPEERRADLWSGVGFACAYAGSPMERSAFERLYELAGPHQLQLAIAGCLAAKRRHGFGHITPHTEQACQVFCGLSGEQAAQIANDALENLPPERSKNAHDVWRERIAAHFVGYLADKNAGKVDVLQ